MAQAIVAAAYGGPEVLRSVTLPDPQPAPGEVVIAVKAAGVNPIDWKVYSGAYGSDPAKLPMRLGFEVAGVVAGSGDGQTGWSPGDEVIARVSGGYADLVTAEAKAVIRRPPTVEPLQAAGLLLGGATAAHTVAATRVSSGDTVLVHGAAGGVGHLVAQLAIVRGATVIGTASERNHEVLRGLGIVPVTYGPGLADRVRAAAPGGVDAAVDTVGTDEALEVSLELIPDRGRIATIANFAHGAEHGIHLLGGGPGADPGTAIREAAIPELARLAGEGRITVLVDRTFPLADAAEAHRYGIAGHGLGRIVLTVDGC
jgi:NADPH:quinone reductase-like Zn-dependent oxidoreductase